MKWRRRSDEVEAILFTGDNIQEIKSFLEDSWRVVFVEFQKCKDGQYLIWRVKKDGNLDIAFLFKNTFVVKCLDSIYLKDKKEFLSEYERVM